MNHLWWKCYSFSISKNYIVSEGGWKEEKKAMIAMWKKFHSVPITNQVECEVRARGEMWHEAKVLMLCVMHLMSFWCAYKFEMAVSCWNLNYFSTLRQKYNEKLKTKMKTQKNDIAKVRKKMRRNAYKFKYCRKQSQLQSIKRWFIRVNRSFRANIPSNSHRVHQNVKMIFHNFVSISRMFAHKKKRVYSS